MTGKVALAILVLFVWLVVFCLGAFINTNPLRSALAQDFQITDFLIIIIAWIPSNLAILSIISGFFGALAKSLLIQLESTKEYAHYDDRYYALKGAVAGFVVYLALLAGTVMMMEKPFETTTPEQYFRISGLNALLAFLAGYRPAFLGRIYSSR